MNRRNFLKNSTVTSLSLSSISLGLSKDPGTETNTNHSAADVFALNEATINGLQEKMKSGVYTSVALTNMYLKRIQEIDKSGPKLHAIIEINPDAVSIAASLDRERKAGKLRGPLHGIPVVVKDNINTGDKMMTTAGSLALSGNIAAKDAFIIKLLREAGAVLIGKTNLSEFANFRSERSASGWSSRGGQTKTPYILDRNPSGSSSGSGSVSDVDAPDGSIACSGSGSG